MAQPDEPVPITTAPNPGTTTPPTSLATSITIPSGVPNNVPINNLEAPAHPVLGARPANSSISAVLIGPNGVTITLFDRVNVYATGQRANFAKVMFERRSATTSIDRGHGALPASTFQPRNPLERRHRRRAHLGPRGPGPWSITDTSPNATDPVGHPRIAGR